LEAGDESRLPGFEAIIDFARGMLFGGIGAQLIFLGQITPNCYLLGGGNDLPTASLGKSIAKKQGKPLLNREQRVKWEIPGKTTPLSL
jgi:hypothetical protein